MGFIEEATDGFWPKVADLLNRMLALVETRGRVVICRSEHVVRWREGESD